MAKPIKIATAQYPITFFKSIESWKKHVQKWIAAAQAEGAKFLLFPEYGAIELTSLFTEDQRADLKFLAQGLSGYISEFKFFFREQAVQEGLYIIAPSIPVLEFGQIVNRTFVFSPDGKVDQQDKFHMTRFEDEEWHIQASEKIIKIFQTPYFNFSINICFDVEFPASAQVAAQAGCHVLLAPSCTETIKGLHRVHIGARARALENQFYVVVSQTVGEADWSPAVDINMGQAAVYGPPDFGFTDDGVLISGQINDVGWIYYDIDLEKIKSVRQDGAVFNFKHQDQIISEYKSQIVLF